MSSSTPFKPENYNAPVTEAKWQRNWDDNKTYWVTSHPQPKDRDQLYYVLEMFPYPSGHLHMGHVRNYTIGDVIARYHRALGKTVLHPIGWDSFGLPAENAAIERGASPKSWTQDNIAVMRGQFKSLGFSFDWGREFATSDPAYYKHEQEIFLSFLADGLAYQKESWVNWDPVEKTVLANEQVSDGRGWRSGALVERRKLKQWFFKITHFADDLLAALASLTGWPDKVRLMQENWIGKSQGASINFAIQPHPLRDIIATDSLPVFTTRPETLFGASFLAIAPNHPITEALAKDNPSLQNFIASCLKGGVSEEAIETAEKLGFDTSLTVDHPLEPGRRLPVYVANYVVMDYGTGAIFGCPAHDQRDLDFAIKYNLPIKPVIAGQHGDTWEQGSPQAFHTDKGVLIHSGVYNGLSCEAAKVAIIHDLEKAGQGQGQTLYRLRDWGISRQRYWGCPIPLIHCPTCGVVPVPKDQLPVTLPDDPDFSHAGNPLDHHPTWKHVPCPTCGMAATRETDTLDTFVDSSWYFARFCDAHNSQDPFRRSLADDWLPVDAYIGGVEHAVLHLLYARFITRSLHKQGRLACQEPFKNLLTQGMVCHTTFKDIDGKWLYPSEVERCTGKDGRSSWTRLADGTPVKQGRSEKMSKSKRNTVDPKEIIETYGADTARLFVVSDSPPDRNMDWSEEGLHGAWRFVNRIWRLSLTVNNLCASLPHAASGSGPTPNEPFDGDFRRSLHQNLHAATQALDAWHLNKAIAALYALANALHDYIGSPQPSKPLLEEALRIFLQMAAPFVPHVTAELWHRCGFQGSIDTTPWPSVDMSKLQAATTTIAVQINGKLRATFEAPLEASRETLITTALNLDSIVRGLDGGTPTKTIYIPQKLINFVLPTPKVNTA